MDKLTLMYTLLGTFVLDTQEEVLFCLLGCHSLDRHEGGGIRIAVEM